MSERATTGGLDTVYAVVATLTFNDRAAAEAELSEIVSRVSSMPGFLGGYWVALGADHGTSVIAFDSQAAAEALAIFAEGSPYAAVTPKEIQVGEVLAMVDGSSLSFLIGAGGAGK